MKRIVITALALLALTGCTTWSLQELRETTPTNDPFLSTLAREYLAFSESEAVQYDWADSAWFADKGLLAAYGHMVHPEDPAQWNIDPAMLPELTAARELLLARLADPAADRVVLGEAQAAYDCWVEQQEEGWQLDHIASCRSRFEQLMAALNPPAPQAALEQRHVVHFPLDSSRLTPEAEQVVAAVLAHLPEGEFDVILHGHADRSGTEIYNQALSEQRAQTVQSVLVSSGLPQHRVSYLAFGESDPAVETADGVAEPANRRVEIFLE